MENVIHNLEVVVKQCNYVIEMAKKKDSDRFDLMLMASTLKAIGEEVGDTRDIIIEKLNKEER
jgi:hypothetical protein